MRQEILETLTIQDIKHQDLRMVAELCGLDVAIKLYQRMAGITISIPRNALREFQEKYILENRNTVRAKELALMLNLTERTVEQIIMESRQKAQDTLFEV